MADHDPLADLEHSWLPHLEQGHAALLRALAGRACPGLAPSVGVHALGLDRHGLTLRLYVAGRATDVHLRPLDPSRSSLTRPREQNPVG